MSEFLKNYQDDVLGNLFTERIQISKEEYSLLSAEEQSKCCSVGEEYGEKFKMLKPIDIPEDEKVKVIMLKNLEIQLKMEKNINTIKSMLVFWVVLTIISLVVAIVMIVVSTSRYY